VGNTKKVKGPKAAREKSTGGVEGSNPRKEGRKKKEKNGCPKKPKARDRLTYPQKERWEGGSGKTAKKKVKTTRRGIPVEKKRGP